MRAVTSTRSINSITSAFVRLDYTLRAFVAWQFHSVGRNPAPHNFDEARQSLFGLFYGRKMHKSKAARGTPCRNTVCQAEEDMIANIASGIARQSDFLAQIACGLGHGAKFQCAPIADGPFLGDTLLQANFPIIVRRIRVIQIKRKLLKAYVRRVLGKPKHEHDAWIMKMQ